MAGRIQEAITEKWRNQDHVKPYHRVREVRMTTPHREEVDGSTIGFGISSPVSGGGSGGNGTEQQKGDLPTTIRRSAIFPGNSVSEAPEVKHDDPTVQLRSKQPENFRRPVVPANTAKDSILGEHVQGPVSQRHGMRQTKNRGAVYSGTVFHSDRSRDPEIEI
jgi:hypothetical protein